MFWFDPAPPIVPAKVVVVLPLIVRVEAEAAPPTMEPPRPDEARLPTDWVTAPEASPRTSPPVVEVAPRVSAVPAERRLAPPTRATVPSAMVVTLLVVP